MKKRKKIIYTAGMLIIAIVVSIIILNPSQEDIWDMNANKLISSFHVISGDADIEDLNVFIPFEWDALYSFAPYTPTDMIYEVIGYPWDNIGESVSEGMNQIVFVNDGKVVCYLYGYPENVKLWFDFGEYEGNHIKLTPNHNLHFTTTLSDSGVRYLTYVRTE